MNVRLILSLLIFFALPPVAEAHRLNEYLQATTVSLGQDSVRLHLHFIAGSAVANKVLLEIDPNGDGFISEIEQQGYAHRVLQGVSLTIDGRLATLQLAFFSFPSENEIKKGIGDIQLYLAAALVSTQASHSLIFENHTQQAFSVYLVNCLLPVSASVHVIGQSRNYDQSRYTLDFTTSNTINTSTSSQGLIDKAYNRAVIKTYFFHGIGHIGTGYDHLLFLCALVLGAASLWDLIKLVTAFTIAHSITLTLATLGFAHLPQCVVESFICASIVFVAVQNICWPKYAGSMGRLLLVFFFGLFHGLGFAGGLLELMHVMSPQMVVYAILGFSVGVEAGNQMVLLPLFGVLQRIRRFQTKRVRPIGVLTFQRLASGLVALAGIYYLCIALATYI